MGPVPGVVVHSLGRGPPWEGADSPFYKWGACAHRLEATGVLLGLTTPQCELEKETLPGLTMLQGHGFGMCLKWMTSKEKFPLPWWRVERHRAFRQGLWPLATSPGSRRFSPVCLLSPFSIVPPEGHRQISHQPLGTCLRVESLKRILYNWVVEDYEIQTDLGLNPDFATLGSLPSYFISQRLNFVLFCFWSSDTNIYLIEWL